jgi:hypothetical protein
MTPARFIQALEALHWDTDVLARVLGCDQSLTEAFALGLEEVPMKLGAWLEVLAQSHEALESEMPVGLKGKRYTGLLQ